MNLGRPQSALPKNRSSVRPLSAKPAAARPQSAKAAVNGRPKAVNTWQPELDKDHEYVQGAAYSKRKLYTNRVRPQSAHVVGRPMSANPRSLSSRLNFPKQANQGLQQTYSQASIVDVSSLTNTGGGGDDSAAMAQSTMDSARKFKLFRVNTAEKSTRKKTVNTFRSDALSLEVFLSERMRALVDMDEGSPARLQIFRELWDEIIDQDKPYGHLLARIKEEYEAVHAKQDENRLRGAYDDLMLEHTRLKRSQKKLQDEYDSLEHEAQRCREENEKLRMTLRHKDKEIEKLTTTLSEVNPSSNSMLLKTQALHARIQELEENLAAATQESEAKNVISTRGASAGGRRNPQMEELIQHNEDMEQKIVELRAEVELLRRREQDALMEVSRLRFEEEEERDLNYTPRTGNEPSSNSFERPANVPALQIE
eukprot:GFYU01004644.1.p1 GENE.GFYU01004644.1~~GFYU01004644.1.p1  ORF type:complete len:425 (+),score=91.67 GFYU01004644.1:219-1493(+)